MKILRSCIVQNCSRKYHAKDFCLMHYKRCLKYGSPLITQKDLSKRREHKKAEQKFLANFNDTQNSVSCWIWQGTKTSRGYGNIAWRDNDRIITIAAHRFSWEYYNNDKIPDGMVICHHCDNPACVNPQHLFLGTPKDNIQDCIAKGRFRRGRKLREQTMHMSTCAI